MVLSGGAQQRGARAERGQQRLRTEATQRRKRGRKLRDTTEGPWDRSLAGQKGAEGSLEVEYRRVGGQLAIIKQDAGSWDEGLLVIGMRRSKPAPWVGEAEVRQRMNSLGCPGIQDGFCLFV